MMTCTCAEDRADSGVDEPLSWWCWMFGCRFCVARKINCGES